MRGVLFLLAGALVAGCSAGDGGEAEALAICQKSIVAQATFGDPETPPKIKAAMSDGEASFVWPDKSFHFRNAFNAKVPQSAMCTVDLKTKKITLLSINLEVIDNAKL